VLVCEPNVAPGLNDATGCVRPAYVPLHLLLCCSAFARVSAAVPVGPSKAIRRIRGVDGFVPFPPLRLPLKNEKKPTRFVGFCVFRFVFDFRRA